MNCPQCGNKLKVTTSRTNPEGNCTVRALFCKNCSMPFYTEEKFTSNLTYRKIATPKELQYRKQTAAAIDTNNCYFCPIAQGQINELLTNSDSAIDAANDFKEFLAGCQQNCRNGNIYNKCTDVPQVGETRGTSTHNIEDKFFACLDEEKCCGGEGLESVKVKRRIN